MRAALWIALAMLVWRIAPAQTVNPYRDQPRAVLAGGVLYRAQCAICHGADGRGLQSIDTPDLALMWARDGVDDQYVFNVIRDGIPGSIMPPHGLNETELWMLAAYLASLVEFGADADFAGDAAHGRRIFAAECTRCHRVGGEAGGVLGPPLAGITRRRLETIDPLALGKHRPRLSAGRHRDECRRNTDRRDQERGCVFAAIDR